MEGKEKGSIKVRKLSEVKEVEGKTGKVEERKVKILLWMKGERRGDEGRGRGEKRRWRQK